MTPTAHDFYVQSNVSVSEDMMFESMHEGAAYDVVVLASNVNSMEHFSRCVFIIAGRNIRTSRHTFFAKYV